MHLYVDIMSVLMLVRLSTCSKIVLLLLLGEDMLSLLYNFLDEALFLFCAEPFFIAKVTLFNIS